MKTAIHGIAAATAIVAAQCAFAAANTYYWNGSYNASFPQKANWENSSGTAPSAHLNGQTEDNLWFQENKYNAKFTGTNNRTVKFSTVVTNKWKVFIRDNGTEAAPLVFDHNGSAAYGLVAGVSTSSGTGFGFNIGDGGAGTEAWLKLAGGTYRTAKNGVWSIGNNNAGSGVGHIVSCEGVTMSAEKNFEFRNGTLDATGTTLNCDTFLAGCATGGGNVAVTKDGGAWTIGTLRIATNRNVNATFEQKAGTLATTGNIEIGDFGAGNTGTALFDISGGTVTPSGNIHLGYSGAAGASSIMKVRGTAAVTLPDSRGIFVGNASAGRLEISGSASVQVGNYLGFGWQSTGDKSLDAGEDSELVLSGSGVLKAASIRAKDTNGGTATITFDGGTLKVLDNANTYTTASGNPFIPAVSMLSVNVTENGGTIDTSGLGITIAEDMAGSGPMAFTGGGTVTLSEAQTGSGDLTVAEGTTLKLGSGVVLSRGAVSLDSGAALAFESLSTDTAAITASSFAFASDTNNIAIPSSLEQGEYKLFTLSEGEFAADAADNIQVQCAVPHSIVVRGDTIYLSIAGHHYIVVYGTTKVSPALQEDSHIIGAGGFNIANLALPAGAKLTYDPVKTPIYVWTQLTVNEGFKFALSENYAGTTCGRIVLLTFKESGVTGLPGTAEGLNALFDASTIAPGAQYAVTVEPAPAQDNVGRRQLVLTVGDYANAPEIRILPIGDSITQGVTRDDQGDYPQYRTSIAARLAASGYRPKMKGVWKFACYNAAHVEEPDDWVWHCGISGDRIRTAPYPGDTTDKRGGVRDNLHLYLDIAGYTDVITLLIGTNDIGSGGDAAAYGYANFKALLLDMAAKRPGAKIVVSTILQRNGEDDVKYQRVVDFNNLLKADFAAGNVYPANVVLLDLFEQIPLDGEGNFFSDKLHMNWAGCSIAAEAFAGKIMEALPLPAFAGTTDATATDEAQTALGAAQTVPAEYRAGMTHVFTIDAANAGNAFGTLGYAPYTTTNNAVSLSRQVTKVGYYMELVRAGTSRRRYVWVDFEATGKTLDQLDFPWTGDNIQFIAEKFHVYSNDSGISNVAANVNSVKGIIEGTYHNYSAADALAGAPADIMTLGWNDTMGSGNAGFGCFQAHRIFSQEEGDTHWNDAQVLFAWNRWSSNEATDEIGIGDYACHASGVGNTMDYTHTVNKGTDGLPDTVGAGAYQVRHLEIWAVPVIPQDAAHGKWIGGAGPDMSTPANWEDDTVPAAGDNLDFSGVTAATAVNADIDAAFGAVTMGTGVVTFNGSLSAKSFTDTSKIAVGENATVALRGDLVFEGGTTQQIVNRVAAGGTFAVDGSIILAGSSYLLPFADNTSEGVISARGLVDNSTNSDAAPFRIGVGNLSNDYGKGGNWLIGYGGLTGSKGFWLQPHSLDVTTLKAGADFDITMPVGVYTPASLNLDTAGHTITVRGGGFYRNGTVRIKGSGKVVCDFDVADISGAQASQLACPYSVEDTATLAVKPGSNLGNGAVSVGPGATLALTAAGTVTLSGGLSAAAGATIVFPFGGAADTTLQIASGATLALPGEGGKVKIATAAGSKFVSGKKYTLVSGANLQAGDLSKFELPEGTDGELSIEDGNLMYRPTGSFIIKIGGTEVPIPADWLKGVDYSDVAELRGAMIGTGANGLPRWQSYCLGLDPANAGSVLTCVPGEGQAQTGKVNIAANVNVPEGLGEIAQITAYLDRRKTDGTWENIETKGSALSGKVAFAAPAPEAALDFFRVRVAIGATASAE